MGRSLLLSCLNSRWYCFFVRPEDLSGISALDVIRICEYLLKEMITLAYFLRYLFAASRLSGLRRSVGFACCGERMYPRLIGVCRLLVFCLVDL